MSNPYPMLENETYMSLTTYRKSGKAVPTPVWFAQEGDKLYITTQAQSGKIKRLRHTPDVEIAPCTVRGEITGESMSAKARIHEAGSPEGKHADALLNKKYGIQKRLFGLMSLFSRSKSAFIEVYVS
jgi:PPOX class probable F420-dependent enzyme